MSFKLALLCLGLNLTCINAQVGMPTNNPNKDAVLDLNRTDGTSAKGLLLPKVALTGLTSASPMTAHVAGMHIWNTATVTGTNGVSPGEYYNNGSKWIRVSSATDAWIQDGNSNGSLKVLGTNDAFDLPIETNGVEKMRVTSGGQVLVNTTTSMTGGTTAKVQINNGTTAGALQIKDGTENQGKVLTSDWNGVGTWQFPAVTPTYVGTWDSAYASISVKTADQTTQKYTGLSITLPPGKYYVNANFGFNIGNTTSWRYASYGLSATPSSGTPLQVHFIGGNPAMGGNTAMISNTSWIIDLSSATVNTKIYFYQCDVTVGNTTTSGCCEDQFFAVALRM
ncbi:hypothetical protein [Flavobacterium sp.]|uniref:hypothetical protein n=1 Tax=Flavobacterium sp. TaxID=239 RepID=UPI002ED9BF5F